MWCRARFSKVGNGCKSPSDVQFAMYDVLVLKSVGVVLVGV